MSHQRRPHGGRPEARCPLERPPLGEGRVERLQRHRGYGDPCESARPRLGWWVWWTSPPKRLREPPGSLAEVGRLNDPPRLARLGTRDLSGPPDDQTGRRQEVALGHGAAPQRGDADRQGTKASSRWHWAPSRHRASSAGHWRKRRPRPGFKIDAQRQGFWRDGTGAAQPPGLDQARGWGASDGGSRTVPAHERRARTRPPPSRRRCATANTA